MLPKSQLSKFPSSLPHQQSDDSDVLIRVENLSKKFCRSLKRSLWYGIQDIASEVIGRQYSHELRSDEFWALKDINFELRQGECLGLIGHNGAGKTTLLRLLNGLIKPDAGLIDIKGRVSALIALGAGFNPVLTGRENVYVNAAVLGLTKTEIEAKLDEIIDFAEIGEFIDAPVQSYSSGMQVRLGFAVATVTRPDILILDEVLAVGDFRFRGKCYEKLSQLRQEGVTFILVSHNAEQIRRLSNRCLLLQKGKQVLIAPPAQALQKYEDIYSNPSVKGLTGFDPAKCHSSGMVDIANIQFSSAGQKDIEEIKSGELLSVDITLNYKEQKPIDLKIEVALVCSESNRWYVESLDVPVIRQQLTQQGYLVSIEIANIAIRKKNLFLDLNILDSASCNILARSRKTPEISIKANGKGDGKLISNMKLVSVMTNHNVATD